MTFIHVFQLKIFSNRSADKIVVLQDGDIVEEGPHEKLMMAKASWFKFEILAGLSKGSKLPTTPSH